jgi:hypothetical protein
LLGNVLPLPSFTEGSRTCFKSEVMVLGIEHEI